MAQATAYRLVRRPLPPVTPPRLDPSQQRVVAHDRGPLLVLAGPGTGKTTTLVEAAAARIEAGLDPSRLLVLTFSRKAADELRERITLRLGRTVAEPPAQTFHGFCFSVLRRYSRPDLGAPRLLSGPERDLRIRELLAGHADGLGVTDWPSSLRPALRLRGFAAEVADLVDRCRERGVDAARLADLGHQHDRPEWVAGAAFLEEYLDVLDIRGEVDYAGLIARTTGLLSGPAAELTQHYDAVYVDEYQDTDPSQERLLGEMAGGGRLLVAVGDPDQSIYGFRGADVGSLTAFPDRFPTAAGDPAPVLSLSVCRRSGPELVALSRRVAQRLPLGALTSRRTEHRDLAAAGPTALAEPQIRLYSSAAAQTAGVADLLRRAHLERGLAWSEMAVLVRSGVRSIPVLRRGLTAAGVPVTVAADEQPLSRDPAVAPLLAALGLVSRLEQAARLARLRDRLPSVVAPARSDDSRSGADGGPLALGVEDARVLLLSPLAGATPGQLRALGRTLRSQAREAGVDPPPPSGELLRDAVLAPAEVTLLDDRDAAPVRRLARVLAAATSAAAADAAPDEVLWELWDGSGWGRRLAERALASGTAGRSANRDLDAVLALFEVAARLQDRQPRATVAALLEEVAATEIPAGTEEEGAAGAAAVRLLTAHRSKGLEWDLVVVCDVQDGVWPDQRARGSLLAADAVAADGPRLPSSPSELTVEERRLFYVAVTRARRQLVLTAVSGVDDRGERPSRFLEETGLAVPAAGRHVAGSLSAASLVARLRRSATSTETPPALRAAAVHELARLADAADASGRRLVPAADPTSWWGRRPLSAGAVPVVPSDAPVTLTGSGVGRLDACPRRWFLERGAKAAEVTSLSSGFGQVVHALAEAVATATVPAELPALLDRLDAVWGSLPFDARWQRDRDREDAVVALERFLDWHRRDSRRLLAVERAFTADLDDEVRLVGRADRLEQDDTGGVVVVDLKTGRNAPSGEEVTRLPQLGVYQRAVQAGAFDDLGTTTGGAELLMLRAGGTTAKTLRQEALDPDDPWVDTLVRASAKAVRDETFPARRNEACDRCVFRTSCPAHASGGQVVT